MSSSLRSIGVAGLSLMARPPQVWELLVPRRFATLPCGAPSSAISISAVSTRARSLASGHSSSACFSLGANGQIIASDVTSRSSGVSRIASQLALIWLSLKYERSARTMRSRSIATGAGVDHVALELGPGRDDAAIAALQRQFLQDSEAADARQRHQEAAVIGLAELGDAPGAAHQVERHVVGDGAGGGGGHRLAVVVFTGAPSPFSGWIMPMTRDPAIASPIIAR